MQNKGDDELLELEIGDSTMIEMTDQSSSFSGFQAAYIFLQS